MVAVETAVQLQCGMLHAVIQQLSHAAPVAGGLQGVGVGYWADLVPV